jgi:hypothetical protein
MNRSASVVQFLNERSRNEPYEKANLVPWVSFSATKDQGVGLTLGVSVSISVAVDEGVSVGVRNGVSVGVGVDVRVNVGVIVAVLLDVAVGVNVTSGSSMGLGPSRSERIQPPSYCRSAGSV